jgi:hypothetical protein
MLRTFLEALNIAKILPKRVLIQFGAKYYGLHLGPATTPQEETDARVNLFEPNFYYVQDDVLQRFCKEHGIHWNNVRPSHILGAVPDAAMNLCFPLAVYAAVQAHLGEKLVYPSDLAAWETTQTLSSATMNAYLAEWAVLTDVAKDQAFNATDDSPFTWGKFWPILASWYGIDYTRPDTSEGANLFNEVSTPYQPPPRGFGPPGKIRSKFTLTEWAKHADVQKAWTELAQRHDLAEKELRDVDRIFGFADMALMLAFSVHLR